MSEKIIKKNLAEACEEYNKIFGANKNLYRIIPTMQDGLKPVARRFIYALYNSKGRTQFIKMSKAAADTTAQFHPHGGASVEDVGAKLASPIANNICYIEGQGNFGSYKNEKAGASRYIECRLSKFTQKCFFSDFEFSNVDMKITYTGDDYEPEYLPSRYPVALFNPQLSGIGYAFASNIPPFNVAEVMEATISLIKNPKAKILLIPDSPTGADIVDDGQFPEINKTGIGTFTLRGSITIDELHNTLTITSIPLQTTIDDIIRKIVELRDKKVFDEIVEIKDYTKNKSGVKTIIQLSQTANPYKTVEKLYSKNTGLKKTYPVGMKMIDDYRDFDYGVKTFLMEWINYRRDAVRSSYNTKLVNAMEEQNINNIMIFILNEDHAEQTIKIVTKSEDKNMVIEKLMKKYKMDSQQANTIANMRMSAFTKSAYRSYLEKKDQLIKTIHELEEILDNDSMIDDEIIDQLQEGIKLFGSPRKSRVVSSVSEDGEVEDTHHVIGISIDGYIKKISEKEKKIGHIGNTTSQYMTLSVSNRDTLIIFDSTGMASRVAVADIPNMKIKNTGVLLERYFSIHGDVVSVLIQPNDNELKKHGNDLFFVFLTEQGFVKKTMLTEFINVNGSAQAIKLPNNDKLVAVEFAYDNTIKDLVIYTNLGRGIRRDINEFSVLKANARGVKQLELESDEYCIGFDKINPNKKYMFYLTTAGRAKITDMKYFPTMKRKDEALSLISLDKNERLVGIHSVSRDDKIIIYKKKSDPEIINLSDLKVSTRAAKAEKLIKTPKGDYVISYAIMIGS